VFYLCLSELKPGHSQVDPLLSLCCAVLLFIMIMLCRVLIYYYYSARCGFRLFPSFRWDALWGVYSICNRTLPYAVPCFICVCRNSSLGIARSIPYLVYAVPRSILCLLELKPRHSQIYPPQAHPLTAQTVQGWAQPKACVHTQLFKALTSMQQICYRWIWGQLKFEVNMHRALPRVCICTHCTRLRILIHSCMDLCMYVYRAGQNHAHTEHACSVKSVYVLVHFFIYTFFHIYIYIYIYIYTVHNI